MTIQDYIFRNTLRNNNIINNNKCRRSSSASNLRERKPNRTNSAKNLTKWNLLNIQQKQKHNNYNDCIKSYKRHRNQIGRSNRTPIETERFPKPSSAPMIRRRKRKNKDSRKSTSRNTNRFMRTSKTESNLPRLSDVKNSVQMAKDQIRFEQVYEDFSEEDTEQHFLFQSPIKVQKFFKSNKPNHLKENIPDYINRSRSDSQLVQYKNQYLTTSNSFFTLHQPSQKFPGTSPAKIARIQRNQKRIQQYASNRMNNQQRRDVQNVRAKRECFQSYDMNIKNKIKYDGRKELLHRKGGYGYFSPSNEFKN